MKKNWVKPEISKVLRNDVHSAAFVSMMDPVFRSDYVDPHEQRKRKGRAEYLEAAKLRMRMLEQT